LIKFGTSRILVPLFCGLKNHDIVGSALPGGRLLNVNLIEQGYLLVEVEVVEREDDDVVLVRHWTDDRVERHR
jgi:hypothetical protein